MKKVTAFLTDTLDVLKTLGGIFLVLGFLMAMMYIGYWLASFF